MSYNALKALQKSQQIFVVLKKVTSDITYNEDKAAYNEPC